MKNNQHSMLPKRAIYRTNILSESTAEATQTTIEAPEGKNLKNTQQLVEELRMSTEQQFQKLIDRIETSTLSDEQKKDLKNHVAQKENEALSGIIQLASRLGGDQAKHLKKLQDHIAAGELNVAAIEGLETAVKGLNAEELRNKIEKEKKRIWSEKASSIAADVITIPPAFALRLATNITVEAVRNVIRGLVVLGQSGWRGAKNLSKK